MDYFNKSSTENEDIELILLERLGPQRRGELKIVLLSIVYVLIFVTGVLGNVLTCMVILHNRYMYTTTNFCLFNLAVSDLLVILVGLPQEVYSFWYSYPWIFGHTFCVLRIMLSETSTYVSILTITTFTVERYIAICHPLLSRALSGLKRVFYIIVVVWIISTLGSIPIFIQYGLVYVYDNQNQPIEKSVTCSIEIENYNVHAFYLSTLFTFILPMTALTVLYLKIGFTIRKSINSNKEMQLSISRKSSPNATSIMQTRVSVLRMLG